MMGTNCQRETQTQKCQKKKKGKRGQIRTLKIAVIKGRDMHTLYILFHFSEMNTLCIYCISMCMRVCVQACI